MRLQDPFTHEWRDGRWEVVSVGSQRLSGKQIREKIRIARKYRQITDI